MTRKKEILDEARTYIDCNERAGFIEGAEWADKNAVDAETSDYFYIRKDKYYHIESLLKTLIKIVKL